MSPEAEARVYVIAHATSDLSTANRNRHSIRDAVDQIPFVDVALTFDQSVQLFRQVKPSTINKWDQLASWTSCKYSLPEKETSEMAEITAEAVRALRAKTDLPLMDCKRALTEANGDETLAIDILRKQGLKVAGKRADNATNEGRFVVAAKADGSEAALVELLCESAPVAKSDDFLNFGNICAQQVLNGPGAANGEELLQQPNPSQPGQTLNDLLLDVINRIREKIVVGRVWKVTGPVGGYVHHDGKTAALFQASGNGTKLDILKDVAMHITAMRPTVTLSSELDTAIVDVEKARLTEEAAASGKPANIIEKMVEGRMKVFYAEKGSLADQLFAKDDTKTVAKALSEAGFTAVGFKRVVLGQP